MPTLELRNLTRVFEGPAPVVALDDVSLTVGQGEFVAIVGPSGGGKSTLLNILGLLDKPSSGDYLISDVSTKDLSSGARSRHRSDTFAFVFQAFHLLDRRPVSASAELGLLYRGVRSSARHIQLEAALSRVGLSGFARRDTSVLSGGERQRVALARALATGAPVLLADEPTGNLDSATSESVVQYLRAVHQAGATVVLVTHDPHMAAIAERRITIRDGRICEDSGPGVSSCGIASRAPSGRASVVRWADMLRDAIGSVVARRGRTLGLITAVAVGVALAVATLGLSQSASSQVSASFDAHANRLVTVAWTPTSVPDSWNRGTVELLDQIQSIEGVTSAGVIDDVGTHELQLTSARAVADVKVFGVSDNLPQASEMDVTWVTTDESLTDDEILLGRTLATQVGLGPLAGHPHVLVDGRQVAVAGIVESSASLPEALAAVLVPVVQAEAMIHEPYRRVVIATSPGAAQQVARQVKVLVDPDNRLNLDVSAPIDPRTLRAEVEADVRTTLVVLTLVAVAASILSLGNSMIMSVIERRQEIGMRRAIGARTSHIVGLVLHESVVIGAAGGVLGLVLGLGGVLAVTIAQRWSPVFDLSLAPLAVLAGIGIGSLAGLLAATRAARIDPSAALKL